jgi:hypothetical protein
MKQRRRTSLFLATVLALFVPGFVPSAQEAAAATQTLPSAREIFDRFVEVTHAKDVLATKTSMHVVGRFEMPAMQMKGAMEAWSAKPNLRLTSIEFGTFGKAIQGYDGKVGWMTHPMVGARVLEGGDLLQFALEADFDAVLKNPERYESLKTLGTESFEGKNCYKVELVAKPLEGMDAAKTKQMRTSLEFYEVDSGLLAGTKGYQESDMGAGPTMSVASDYKDFGGQLMAAKTTMKTGGQEFLLLFDSVEYDTATDATFALPKEIQDVLASRAAKSAPKPQ